MVTKTVDVTPTWEGLVKVMLHLYVQSKDNRADLMEEFRRMAEAADRWNAHCKNQA